MVRSCLTALNIIEPESKIRMETEWRFMQRQPEKLYDKELEALEQIDSTTFRRRSPTVAEYCEKWLLMQSVHVRATTLTDYTSKVRRHIIGGLGDKRMADVSRMTSNLPSYLFPRSRLRFISLW